MSRSRPEIRRLLAAEYVLGNLRGPARRRFERLRDEDAAYCVEADAWEARLADLVDALPGVEPPAPVWQRIAGEIGAARPPAELRLRRRLGLWRGTALAAVAAAVVLLLLLIAG